MIPLLVFYIHIVGATWAFTLRWQEDGAKEGFLAVAFMALIFFVGWSMSSFLLQLAWPDAWNEPGRILDRDGASLLLLTASEAVLYYLLLRK